MTVADEAREHVAAFNAHDAARLLAKFDPDAVWITGADRFAGTVELTELFGDALWAMRPSLEIRAMVADDVRAALQLHESLTIDGEEHAFDIAVFLEFADGLITRAKVYREGSADLDT